jgi:hypothetical protein
MTSEDRYKKMQAIPDGGWAYIGSEWYVRPPGCPVAASVANHDVTLHDDGTITVSPSILYSIEGCNPPYNYHGWLVHGEWRAA